MVDNLERVAKEAGRAMAQESLTWMLSKPFICSPVMGITSVKHVEEGFSVIPGSRNAAHIQENIAVYGFALSDADMARMRSLDQEKRFFTSTWEEIQRFNDWKPED